MRILNVSVGLKCEENGRAGWELGPNDVRGGCAGMLNGCCTVLGQCFDCECERV